MAHEWGACVLLLIVDFAAAALTAICLFAMQPWVESTVNATGHTLGADADVPWLKVTPVALRGVLNWITNRYGPVELKVRQTHANLQSHRALQNTQAVGSRL